RPDQERAHFVDGGAGLQEQPGEEVLEAPGQEKLDEDDAEDPPAVSRSELGGPAQRSEDAGTLDDGNRDRYVEHAKDDQSGDDEEQRRHADGEAAADGNAQDGEQAPQPDADTAPDGRWLAAELHEDPEYDRSGGGLGG